MDKRLFSISEQTFNQWVLGIFERSYIWKGRPPKRSRFKVFCGTLHVLRTGVPLKDLPQRFGNWHTVFTRFQRGNERGLRWKILADLQKQRKATRNVVICDSRTFKYQRHGGGQKGGSSPKAEVSLD